MMFLISSCLKQHKKKDDGTMAINNHFESNKVILANWVDITLKNVILSNIYIKFRFRFGH